MRGASFVLAFLNLVCGLGLFVAWWAVTFTRRYPQGIFNFLVGVEAWQMRASAYQWAITRAYPPFTKDEDPGYPLRCDIAYPEQGIARWRPLVRGPARLAPADSVRARSEPREMGRESALTAPADAGRRTTSDRPRRRGDSTTGCRSRPARPCRTAARPRT